MVFEKMKQAKADRAAAEAAAQRAKDTQALAAEARRVWEAWDAAKLEATADASGVLLKKGEVAYGAIQGAGYVEPKREPGQWAGRSSGYSFHIAKRVNYRIGATKGQFVQGEERPTVTDVGLFVVTNQRCIFTGPKKSTEWAYAKLLGYALDGEAIAIFNVSNRQKATGVAYTVEVEPVVDALIAAAIAKFQGDEVHAQLMAELETNYRTAYDAWKQSEAALPS